MEKCSYAKKCGGCQYQGIAYEEQLKEKEKKVRKLMKDFGKPEAIRKLKKYNWSVRATLDTACIVNIHIGHILRKTNLRQI